ncbi:caspase recruitment domain-containing protein 8-like isoform X4 [Buteo buteo]|uniref:caspase recruitment domain-containing protein 8-like isoform X4 n=1 Tax=Buteo buteo TaxID=30397 RepID=UPI003EBDF48F
MRGLVQLMESGRLGEGCSGMASSPKHEAKMTVCSSCSSHRLIPKEAGGRPSQISDRRGLREWTGVLSPAGLGPTTADKMLVPQGGGTRIEGVTEPQTWPVLVSDPRTGLLPVSDFSGLFTDEGDAFLGTRQQLLIHCCYLQGSELPCQAELCFTVNPSPPPASTTQCATPHISGKLATLMLQVPPEVTPEITQDLKRRTVYRAHLPGAGIFQCSITGLSFEVKSAVTITYRYATWTRHLSKADQETWSPAGPLFHIEVQPGVVLSVHLPHFICLSALGELLQPEPFPQRVVPQGPAFPRSDRHLWGHASGAAWTFPWSRKHLWGHQTAPMQFRAWASEDVNTSLFCIAHFKSGTMILERLSGLMCFSAALENPSFSLLGVLWRRFRSTLNSFPMHSSVLIFQQLSAANTTLHLYLIPDDKSVKQARLPFCYKSPKEEQLFVEIYIRKMAEEITFSMIDTRDDSVVWRASLRSGDINLPACVSKTLSGTAFLKKHKTKLCVRMRQLPSILLHLRDANVINSDEEEEVQSQVTSQRRNKVLLELVEKKGLEAQGQLYQILQMKDPYLVADLDKYS